MAMFGKTIGNGYALTAIVGKESVMKSAQDTFISSTFWTERIGPTAALKTLEVMQKVKSWETITEIGLKVRKGWNELAKNNDLKISISGIPALSSYSFEGDHNLEFHTYVTQEMLKKGFLAADRLYACTEHNDEILTKYFDALNGVFKNINDITKSEKNIKEFLEGPVRHSGFKKIN
jgi:glutamate-1-semialdehyde 2,1-aminomutase